MKKLVIFGLFLNAALLAGRFWQELPIASGGWMPPLGTRRVLTTGRSRSADAGLGTAKMSAVIRALQIMPEPRLSLIVGDHGHRPFDIVSSMYEYTCWTYLAGGKDYSPTDFELTLTDWQHRRTVRPRYDSDWS